MAEMTDFQKQFFSKGTQNTLFTQKEFDDALDLAKAEIITMAVAATKDAILMEREACAKLVDEWTGEKDLVEIAKAILNRIPSQRQ
jgi:hypothetical protein